jgi:hypothetical protein
VFEQKQKAMARAQAKAKAVFEGKVRASKETLKRQTHSQKVAALLQG